MAGDMDKSMSSTDDPRVMALRGAARDALSRGVDAGKVAYDLVHDARRDGVPRAALPGIFDTLRAEGLIPHDDRP